MKKKSKQSLKDWQASVDKTQLPRKERFSSISDMEMPALATDESLKGWDAAEKLG